MCNWNYDYFKSNDSAKNILNKVDWFQKENILYIFLKIDAKEMYFDYSIYKKY